MDFMSNARLGEQGKSSVIYYANKTLNEAQRAYTTIKKELLAMVFTFDKFRNYLLHTAILLFIDHWTPMYFLNQKDAKARPTVDISTSSVQYEKRYFLSRAKNSI